MGGEGETFHQLEICLSTRAREQIPETGALCPWTWLYDFDCQLGSTNGWQLCVVENI